MRKSLTPPAALLLAAVLACGLAACQKENPTPDTPEGPADNGLALPSNPRYLAAHGGKVYATCYNPASVIRIDTATRRVEAVCRLGQYYPEGIAVAGGRLFVASSWIADESGYTLRDNRLYVVDLASFTVDTTLVVGLNPQQVVAVDEQHVAVNHLGDYGGTPGGCAIVDAQSLDIAQTGVELTAICAYGGLLYGYCAPYGDPAPRYMHINPLTLEATQLEGIHMTSPYCIKVIDGDIYTSTGPVNANSDLYRLGPDGTQRWRCEAGMLASRVADVGDGTAYVLNEGLWGGNNASLDRVVLASGSIEHNVFAQANGRGLGDIAQDLLVYGSRAYISVSFSNTIEVVSTRDNSAVQIAL